MADLFSIAGSAVGVVSLAITVCQGLHQYYSSSCDGPDDIKAFVTSLDGLIHALDVLGDTIKDNCFDASTQAHIESCIADCDDAIQNLARELEKMKKAVPLLGSGGRLSLMGKLSNAGKTLLYPFRESTLKKLRGYVEEVCENLTVATSSVQL